MGYVYIYMNHHIYWWENESMGYPIESPVRITFPSIPKSMLFMQNSWDMDGILTIYCCCNGDWWDPDAIHQGRFMVDPWYNNDILICAVKMHLDIAQEPFCVKFTGKYRRPRPKNHTSCEPVQSKSNLGSSSNKR